ncbi:flagellar basal body-associated FliL family protein [Vitreimonas sp.]|uniref:flagellar basal body-associated FliL family protein n=1 Tax=Vitreimonas sp. TaxID=3069702 RepID=UPI002D794A53|nr:flagellar basal body-associated FliL family protein [Vitreimonas sp.]
MGDSMFGKGKKKNDEAPAEEAGGAPPSAEGAEGAEGEAPAKKKMSGKKLVLFIILPAVLVLGGGGAAAFLLLGGGGGEQHASADAGGHGKQKGGGHGAEGAAGEAVPGPNGTMISHGENVVFVALPEMLVNITGPDGRPAYLKLKLTLEAPNDETVTALTEHVPRISDQFNGFLRELRTDDLAGSAGAYRLRLELLRRVNLTIAPLQINAVLIEEMLVQ